MKFSRIQGIAAAIAFASCLGLASPAQAGMSCSITTTAPPPPMSEGFCEAIDLGGPPTATALFVFSHYLLGDGSFNPTIYWSHPSCPNLYNGTACELPVYAFFGEELSATFYLGPYEIVSSATALYMTDYEIPPN